MTTNNRRQKEHQYFVVPQLKPRENCLIIESKATFNQKAFAEEIKDQLLHLELCKDDLSKMTYIKQDRINSILNCKGRKITDAEIKEIKRKLYIS